MSNEKRGMEIVISLVLALPVLITFIYLVLHPRGMDGGTLAIVRILAAIFAGVAGYYFTGGMGLEASIPFLNKSQVSATGGFAAFILVLLTFFYGIPQSSGADNVQKDVLNSGDKLTLGQSLTSPNKCFYLTLQDDGNLVLYSKSNDSLWSSNTFKQPSSYATMQRDGNFVIYDNNRNDIWASNTYQSGGSRLKIENDGNVAIYKPNNTIIWETNTGGKRCN